jgi:SPP1 family predicted phage head-tail adaptor
LRLPKQATGVRYLGSTDYNTHITVVQPNMGNAPDGSPLPEVVIATTWASVSMWRGKEEDKPQTLQTVSSYKIVIRYPRTWSLDAGMNILVRGQTHNIDSFFDADGTRTELSIWTWVGDATANGVNG